MFLSSVAERINEMKSQNLGLCSRPILVKLVSCNRAFPRNERECAERYLKCLFGTYSLIVRYHIKVQLKVGLIIQVQLSRN